MEIYSVGTIDGLLYFSTSAGSSCNLFQYFSSDYSTLSAFERKAIYYRLRRGLYPDSRNGGNCGYARDVFLSLKPTTNSTGLVVARAFFSQGDDDDAGRR